MEVVHPRCGGLDVHENLSRYFHVNGTFANWVTLRVMFFVQAISSLVK